MSQMLPRTQSDWEASTGWVENPKGLRWHPVTWITNSRKIQDESWPNLSAWDHAVPVEHSVTGEKAYLLMPYSMSEAAGDQLGDWCHPRGLMWELLAVEGWWQPGTCAVLVRAVS